MARLIRVPPSLRPWVGLEDGLFDVYLKLHRRRLLDRLGLALIVLGLVAIVVALAAGQLGNLGPGDWVGAGSVLVAAGGLFLSLGPSDHE